MILGSILNNLTNCSINGRDLSHDVVKPGQWGYAEEIGYVKYDPKEDDEEW
ncbi:hypothetical protein [Ammoniphilus sp. 3BR4]|uniref:hypothetical protein n=1 Tax=Ammoniphilus sp. 3BR4 TaxID=3158265 RepID=UPI0034653F0A